MLQDRWSQLGGRSMHEVLYRRAQEAVDDNTPATPTSLQLPFATERGFAEVRVARIGCRVWGMDARPASFVSCRAAARTSVVTLVGGVGQAHPCIVTPPLATDIQCATDIIYPDV